MKYRQLPRTDLLLSEVGFGVWTVATNWWGRIPEETRRQLLEDHRRIQPAQPRAAHILAAIDAAEAKCRGLAKGLFVAQLLHGELPVYGPAKGFPYGDGNDAAHLDLTVRDV